MRYNPFSLISRVNLAALNVLYHMFFYSSITTLTSNVRPHRLFSQNLTKKRQAKSDMIKLACKNYSIFILYIFPELICQP